MVLGAFDGLEDYHPVVVVALLLVVVVEGPVDPERTLALHHIAVEESLGRCFGDLILWLKSGALVGQKVEERRVVAEVTLEFRAGRAVVRLR
jgi:hypothetical protein